MIFRKSFNCRLNTNLRTLITVCFLLFFNSACSTIPSPSERRSYSLDLAQKAGWVAFEVHGPIFSVWGLAPEHPAVQQRLNVYIEGDGLAWISSWQVSSNPTPVNPVALKMALADVSGAAVYLARPCQYSDLINPSKCAAMWWTSHRFAPEVVSAMSLAIDHVKQAFGSQEVAIIGYSGGGALAAILAGQRKDTVALTTVAGNLDHILWTKIHRLTPLTGSLNAVDWTSRLKEIPQLHMIGEEDQVVPRKVLESYLSNFPSEKSSLINFSEIKGFDHECCWAEQWSTLQKTNVFFE